MRITRGAKIEKESKSCPSPAIIGALAVVLITSVTLRTSFPVPYYVAAILLLLAIFSLHIYGPIYDFFKKKEGIRKHNALARKHFDEFTHFTERFGEFLDQGRSDNIPYVLRDLLGNQAFRCVSYLSTGDFYNLFNCYKERLKRFDKTKEDFSLLVNEFDLILDMYNEHCVYKPVREIRAIGREKVDEETKDNYKKQKGAYELFLRNYMDFGKKLNNEFGERIFRDYFEMPGEL